MIRALDISKDDCDAPCVGRLGRLCGAAVVEALECRATRHRALIATVIQVRKTAGLNQCQLARRLDAASCDSGMGASNQGVVLTPVVVESDPRRRPPDAGARD